MVSRNITYEEVQNNSLFVYSEINDAVIDLVDKDGNVHIADISNDESIAYLSEDLYPIKFRVTLNDDDGAMEDFHHVGLDYIGLTPDYFHGYVRDSNGIPYIDAKMGIKHYESYSEPTTSADLTNVSGYGNITLLIHKDGQPVSDAKIRVQNAWGMDYYTQGATNSQGMINITGMESQTGWQENSNYEFTAYSLDGKIIRNSLGEKLNVTVTFSSGEPDTNPAKIWNSEGIDETHTIYTGSNGEFSIDLNNSRTYQLTIHDSNGNLLYEDAINPPLWETYGASEQEDTGDEPDQDTGCGNPDSKYNVELSKSEIYPDNSVKVYVKKSLTKEWWEFWKYFSGEYEYIEGAEVYVDGASTGKKTRNPSMWESVWGEKPHTTISFNDTEIGEHCINAVITWEEGGTNYRRVSQGTGLTVKAYDTSGGYPRTSPDEDGYYFKLWADRDTVKGSGDITFKVYRMNDGEKLGMVGADIFVDGNIEGQCSGWPWADATYTHEFTDLGTHTVYARYNGKKTGEMYINVIKEYEEKSPTDSGDLNLTVSVEDGNGNDLSNILVQRKSGGDLLESKFTGINGQTTLYPVSGTDYTIYAIDPSNNYVTTSYTGNWSSDTTINLTMTQAGDTDDDNQKDTTTKSIELTIDGYSRDVSLHKGVEHTIKVLDSKEIPIRGAKIYVDDNKIGTTDQGAFRPAEIKHDFSTGSHIVRAEYNGMVDSIEVKFRDEVDPDDPDAVVLVAIPEGRSNHVIGNVTVDKGQKVLFQVTKQGQASSIWDWTKISDATVFVNGSQAGLTGKTTFNDIAFGFGGAVGYVHTFQEPGEYKVNATTTSTQSQIGVAGGESTQSVWVTVTEDEYTTSDGTFLGELLPGWLGSILNYLSTQYPILGFVELDQILWLLIMAFGCLFAVNLVLRIVF